MTALAAPPADQAAPGRLRRSRSTLLIVAFLVLAVAVVALTSGGPSRSDTYDPDNPGTDGAQALARVLADQGVDVSVVRSADAFDDATVDADTTVVVTSSDRLGTSTVDRLRDHAGTSRIVVVDPGTALLEELGVGGYAGSTSDLGPVAAGCAEASYDGLEIEVDEAITLPLDGCFDDTLAASGTLVLLGAGQILANDQVLRADNAAVALRLLGGTDRLVWYLPSTDDLTADDSVGIGSLLPDWIGPGLVVLLLASIGLVLWRARRLGPLATEPLPVVVKAIETTLSRGRLYRRSGDRRHAAAVLRTTARGRATAVLRIGAGADERALVSALARHTGRTEAELWDLVGSGSRPPATDRELIALANALAALDREVRHP